MMINPSIPELAAELFAKKQSADLAIADAFRARATGRHAINQLLDATVGNVYGTLRSAIRAIDAVTELAQDCVKAKENTND